MEQNKNKLSQEEIIEQFQKTRQEHELKMKNNPEYKALWEKRMENLEKKAKLIGENKIFED